jgi:hypothetical protein
MKFFLFLLVIATNYFVWIIDFTKLMDMVYKRKKIHGVELLMDKEARNHKSDRISKPSISPFGLIMACLLSIGWSVLISVAIRAGIENSRDTIAR